MEGSLYYVTCQSHHSNELFKDGQDYDKYLGLLANFKNKYHFKLFSYCLLSDKVYLLIGINSESSISEVMFNLNSSYTKYYNSRHGKKGPVLAGRFKSKWVEKKTELLPLTRYIHLVYKEKDHLYSSYSAFLGKPVNGMPNIPIADEIQETISCLPANTDYKTYVEKVDSKELKDLEQKLARNRFLGSKEFEQKVKTTLKAYKENKKNKVTAEKVEPAIETPPAAKRAGVAGGVVLQKSPTLSSRRLGEHIPKNLPRRPARQRLAGGFEKYQRGLLWGSVAVTTLLLLLVGYFYSRQLLWKEEFKVAQEEFEQKLTKLEQAQVQPFLPNLVGQAKGKLENLPLEKKVENITNPLEGIVLEIKLGPISSEVSQEAQIDILKFKEGRFVSNILTQEGFGPSNYSLMYKEKGVIVWETMQSGDRGAIASWHGKWDGEVMKGILSQKFPGEEAKTFSFVGYLKTSAQNG